MSILSGVGGTIVQINAIPGDGFERLLGDMSAGALQSPKCNPMLKCKVGIPLNLKIQCRGESSLKSPPEPSPEQRHTPKGQNPWVERKAGSGCLLLKEGHGEREELEQMSRQSFRWSSECGPFERRVGQELQTHTHAGSPISFLQTPEPSLTWLKAETREALAVWLSALDCAGMSTQTRVVLMARATIHQLLCVDASLIQGDSILGVLRLGLGEPCAWWAALCPPQGWEIHWLQDRLEEQSLPVLGGGGERSC